jgi:membrane protease YdiL (CAAX protease family)
MAIAAEAVLLLFGWGLAKWLGLQLVDRRDFGIGGVVLGVVASAPLLLGLWWILTTRAPSVRRLVHIVENQLGPLLVSRSMLELALLAAFAGAAEEVVFRGVLQVWFARLVPSGVALLLAAVLFGVAHSLTRAYALLATVGGIYLGMLFSLEGNLVVPIVAHAVYDLLALNLLVRRHRAVRDRSE